MMITVNQKASESLAWLVNVDPNDPTSIDQEAVMNDFIALWSGIVGKIVLENLFYGLAGIFAQSTIVLAVAELYAGRHPTMVECAKKAISFFCNIFCAGFLVGIGFAVVYCATFGIVIGCMVSGIKVLPFVGFVLAVVAAVAIVYVSVAMMIIAPVIMVEQKSAPDAIKRAWELAAGNRCFIYCTVFVLALAKGFLNGILSSIVFAGRTDGMIQFSVFGSIVGSISFLAYFPIASIMITVVYFKIRIEQEGMDCNVLLSELDQNKVSVLEGGDDDNFKYAAVAIDSGKLEEPDVVTKV